MKMFPASVAIEALSKGAAVEVDARHCTQAEREALCDAARDGGARVTLRNAHAVCRSDALLLAVRGGKALCLDFTSAD